MVGRTLGRYKLVEEIGQGGMAVVYRGLDTTLQREVAVKILHPHLSRKEANRERFAREARVVATLHHDNIVEIYDFSGGDEGEAFIVCEYIRGRTLADFIEKGPALPVEVSVMMIAEIGHALSHAHAAGVIHRDIKPENVMIRQDGVLKLMDFGIARVQEDTGSTMTGALIGSPAYMSPEQVGGHPVDTRSDLFAVAVLLYRLLTGRLPFDAPTPAAVLRAVETIDPEPPRQINPLVSRALDAIVLRALAKDPAKRQASVDELIADAMSSIADAGLGPPRDELKTYFADPATYAEKLRGLLAGRYAKAGHERRRAGDTAAAMEIWSRVLEMDPANEEVRRALDDLSRGHDRRRLVRTAIAGLAAIGVAGSAGAAAWSAWPQRTATATPTPIAETQTSLPSPTATLAEATPARTPARTAAVPSPTPAKTIVAAAPSPAATGTLVAFVPTATPIPAGAAVLEFDILTSAKVYVGHEPGIVIGDTFQARRGIVIPPDRLSQILKQCNGLCRVAITPDEEMRKEPRLADCLPLVATVRLVEGQRATLLDKSGQTPLTEKDLYLRGCQTQFRVEVPVGAEAGEVRIDGKPTPVGSVFETLTTTAGVHELSVKAPGFREWKQRVEIRTSRPEEPFVVKAMLEPAS